MAYDHFYELTPYSVLDAVESAGYQPIGVCSPMNSLENRVFRISIDQNTALAAKFYRPGRWTADQIQEEHAFLKELVDEDLPVAAPLMLANGSTLDSTSDIYFALWELRGGRQKDEFLPEELMMLGRLIARIHDIGENTDFQYRPVYNVHRYLDEPLEYLEEHELLDGMIAQTYRDCVYRMKDAYLRASEGQPSIRLHGDCHIGNILFRDETPLFLDFDDSLMGPPVQDLWMLSGGRDQWKNNRHFLMEGYRTFRDFPERWWDLTELLRGLRMVYYTGWLARRRADPAFKPYFSNFGSRDFWASETLELQQLLSNL